MEKSRLLNFIKKTHKFYSSDAAPKDVYYSLISNPEMREAFNSMLKGKDIALYSFLVPKFKENPNIEDLYDAVNNFLTAFRLSYIEEHNPTKKCDKCDNGLIDCDECYGNGEVTCNDCRGKGNTECDDCGGDGEDSEGESCNTCQGGGTLECNTCHGTGDESCNECDNGYVGCDECDGSGNIETSDTVLIERQNYLTYNPEIIDMMKKMEEGKVFDESLLDSMYDSGSVILLNSVEDYSDYDIHVDREDGEYVFEFELRNPKLNITPYSNLTIIWKSEP
jgi:hypothetical protein